MPSSDPMGDALSRLLGAVLVVVVALSAAPLLIPLAANRLVPDMIATKTRFWMVLRWHWVVNALGIVLVAALIAVEVVLLTGWVQSGEAREFADGDWAGQLLPTFGGWLVLNLLSGVLLLPVVWSHRRRTIAERVRTRRITNVLVQERIESARKRAADAAAASVATGAILAFVALVLGAGAGWLGGRSGVVHPVYADRVVPTRRQP